MTFRDLSTRQMSPQVPSLVITFASSAGLTALASLGQTWVQPDWHLSGLIVLSALFIFAGYCSSVMVMVMVMVMRVGELSAVTLFRYTSLLWALLLGWLMFDEWPTALTFLGVVIVAATGLYTLYRESKLSRWGRKYLQDVIAINRKASLKQGFTRRIETGHVEELWHRNLY